MVSPSRHTHGLRIFLMEDHGDTCTCLERYLVKLGHQVQAADTMQHALASEALEGCEMLICDVGLPDGDGWTLLRILRAKNYPCARYAVAISGFGTSADLAVSHDAGFRHHLIKPLSPEALDTVLAEAAAELRRSG